METTIVCWGYIEISFESGLPKVFRVRLLVHEDYAGLCNSIPTAGLRKFVGCLELLVGALRGLFTKKQTSPNSASKMAPHPEYALSSMCTARPGCLNAHISTKSFRSP